MPGKISLFLVFLLFNTLLFLSSLGIIGCAGYLFYFTKDANLLNICFMLIGLTLMILTVVAYRTRQKIYYLGVYIFILFLIFLSQIFLTVLIFLRREDLIAWAEQNMADS